MFVQWRRVHSNNSKFLNPNLQAIGVCLKKCPSHRQTSGGRRVISVNVAPDASLSTPTFVVWAPSTDVGKSLVCVGLMQQLASNTVRTATSFFAVCSVVDASL
jgi:hypothetical protein